MSGDRALAQGLLDAVRAQDFGHTPDMAHGGAAVAQFPSLDLAVVAFAPGQSARFANVLFSREHADGLVAEMSGTAGSVANVRYDADQQDTQGVSIAWQPAADWSQLSWTVLQGTGPHRFVAPYPASLLKLMVAVGVALAVEAGCCAWPAALEPMIVISDNDATTELVALLHRHQLIGPLHHRLAQWGLGTLQLNGTRPDGGWRNADGSGVGQIHMTAWDTARLLWLLDAQAPPPPWLDPEVPRLQPASSAHLHAVLQRQALDHVLSSGLLRDLPGWVPGLPDAPAFAHKTGSTENYASDAGIVRSGRLHYVVAVLSSLGSRYAPHPDCATTWRLPALGAAVHALMERTA